MKPKPSVHSCAHQSLGKRSCHLTARQWRTTLCRHSRHVVDPLASLPIKLGWINTFTLRNRKISWNNTSCNNGAFGANGVQSGRTSFHTKCFHSGEETTKVLKSVPQVVRRSYSCLYPWSMRACSTTSCLQKQVFVSGCLQKQVFISGWEMVPKVHRLMEVGHAISHTIHRAIGIALWITLTLVFACLST